MMRTIIQLNKLIKDLSKEELETLLKDFKCSRNKDSEHFLKNIAVRHESKDISRTYLLIDDMFKVSGYFTLALKCLGLDEEDLDHDLTKMMNLKDDVAQAWPIGQLARADDCMKGFGKVMLDEALNTLSEGKKKFGCRMVRLDCKDELMGYYSSLGFRRVRKNDGKDLNQMIRFI